MNSYTIVENNSYETLSRIITNMIQDDWLPQGGIAVSIDQGTCYYTQAMTTECKDPKDINYYSF